jgi:predicted transposase/invertase (TIGR01784 family)
MLPMTERISPTNDLALKKVLSSEENKDILQGLVHDFFDLEVDIADITLDHPYSIKDYREMTKDGKEALVLRQTIPDVTASFVLANLTAEFQIKRDTWFSVRSLYYAFDRFCSEYNKLPAGSDTPGSLRFSSLKPVYALNILGFNHFSQDGDALRIFGLYDVDRHKAFETEYVRLAYFELQKDNVETVNLRHWRDYFTKGEVLGDAPDYIQKASRIIEVVNLDEKEREMVDIMEKARAVYESTVYTSYLDGKAEGLTEGEAKRSLEVAHNLLSQGIDPDIVAISTGLDIETLKGLQN